MSNEINKFGLMLKAEVLQMVFRSGLTPRVIAEMPDGTVFAMGTDPARRLAKRLLRAVAHPHLGYALERLRAGVTLLHYPGDTGGEEVCLSFGVEDSVVWLNLSEASDDICPVAEEVTGSPLGLVEFAAELLEAADKAEALAEAELARAAAAAEAARRAKAEAAAAFRTEAAEAAEAARELLGKEFAEEGA